MTVPAAVDVEAISKSYGDQLALEGLTFVVPAGQLVGVLGPNGAGKTTAMRILTTILAPDAGKFSVAGIPSTAPQRIRARIGVLPESSGYPERQGGEEYLRHHARLFGQARGAAQATASRLLDEVGLADRGRSLISTYSRGMRQRLGIARALVNDPAVVFLDEPTLGLDPAGQRDILARIRGLVAERGMSVLLSTHLLDEVQEHCTSVLILDRARLVAEGTVAQIVDRAAAVRRCRIRVTREHGDRGAGVLRRSPLVQDVLRIGPDEDVLSVGLKQDPSEGSLNGVVGVLLDAGVELLSCELERISLGDAFHRLTAGDAP